MTKPNKDQSKRNRRNKTKGREFQGKIAKFFREIFPMAHNTGVRQATDQCDVENTAYWIECKTGKKPSITKAFVQALLKCLDNDEMREVVVITHHEKLLPNGKSIDLVTIDLSLFERLLKGAIANVNSQD